MFKRGYICRHLIFLKKLKLKSYLSYEELQAYIIKQVDFYKCAIMQRKSIYKEKLRHLIKTNFYLPFRKSLLLIPLFSI